MMSEWISVGDRLPEYGEPVIISIKNIVQKVTYILDGSDDCPDWFEPYHFDHDDEIKCWWHKVEYWQSMPEPPHPE